MRIDKLYSPIIITIIAISGLTGCATSDQKDAKQQFVEVIRGSITTSVISDGNLVMPHEVKLKFGTPGVIEKIYVEKGDRVKAGTILAKIDDTIQQLAVMSAQYDVELGLNDLAERIYPALLGYPHYYPSTTALLRVDQALEELNKAKDLIDKANYLDSSVGLRVATHDLEESLNTLKAVITDMVTYPDLATALKPLEGPDEVIPYEQSYPSIPESMNLLKENIEKIYSITKLQESGSYKIVLSSLDTFIKEVEYTRSVVNKVCGRIVRVGVQYPDASTSLDVLRQAETGLRKMQELMGNNEFDAAKMAEQMRIVQHDLETSHRILEKNDLIFKNGLNLKVLRQYNINLQKTELALQRSKEDLMKTEILAPFDGMIVDIGIKENDQLSAYDYSSKTAIHLVDTSTIKMEGVVDEIDIFKVKKGQKAIITLDALPTKEFTGKVTFISPFSTQVAGVANFPINIMLDKTNIELRGGLTSTANIIIDGHENIMVIPNNALQGSSNNYWVEVVRDGSKSETEKRNVVIGIQNELKTEIISGLIEGEKILVNQVKSNVKSTF
jgi:RND family efflux transporter MFP subunit